jgi:hypothetical protein
MASSGMLLRVTLIRTDVSEEVSASFIRDTRIQGTASVKLFLVIVIYSQEVKFEVLRR